MKTLRLFVLLALSFCGCAGTTQHGDARLIDTSKRIVIGIPKRYWLELPPVKLSEPANTVFHVHGLPKFRLGMDYYFALRTKSAKPPQGVVVTVNFKEPSAGTFFTRTYRLDELSWDRDSRTFESQLIPVRFGGGTGERNERLENATDYDLTLIVVTPSHDPHDTLSIRAAGF